jgi:tripartite-type tricarboxylate transporter receptor subunit TctC
MTSEMARLLRSGVILGALAMLPCITSAAAEPYPAGPVRIVVGFGPGSTADLVARLVGKYLEERLGKPFIVENRPGNSSMIAAEAVAKAQNDGQTLFMATVANTLNPAHTKDAFNLGKNLQPIALIGVVPNVLVAHGSVPVKTVGDLIALAKKDPTSLTFAISGQWTASHMAAELFNEKAGTRILTVPYQGRSSQALTDLLTGRINLTFYAAAALPPYVSSGELTALAVGQPKRTSIMPDVPTMDEAGLSGIDVGVWVGLLAPAGTSPEIINVLAQACNDALKQPAIKDAMKAQGVDVLGSTPAEFADFIQNDIQKWQGILESMGTRE